MTRSFHGLILVLIAAVSSAIEAAAEPTGTLLVVNKGGDSVTMLDVSDGRELAELPTGRDRTSSWFRRTRSWLW